jgi:hypothetical protein
MANAARPDGDIDERDHDEADRGNNPSEPPNPQVIANGDDEVIHESREFPSGGGDEGSVRIDGVEGDSGG